MWLGDIIFASTVSKNLYPSSCVGHVLSHQCTKPRLAVCHVPWTTRKGRYGARCTTTSCPSCMLRIGAGRHHSRRPYEERRRMGHESIERTSKSSFLGSIQLLILLLRIAIERPNPIITAPTHNISQVILPSISWNYSLCPLQADFVGLGLGRAWWVIPRTE